MTPLRVTYRFSCAPGAAEAFADALLVEQTVETPRSVSARYPFVQAHLNGARRATWRTWATGSSGRTWRSRPTPPPPTRCSFLSVLFGNASLHPSVALDAFALPEALTQGFGPAFGIDGLRRITGVQDRPLVMSALKPAGLTPDELAALAHALARGGADLVKDDHYLGAQPTAPFAARVPAIAHALDAAAQATGRRTAYAPNVSGTPSEVLRQAESAATLGADALLVCPALVGLPTLLELRRFGLPLLAHPAFSGTFKAPPALVQGQLFRLYGADAVIFAGYGGRFAMPPEACRAIADAATQPWHALRAALPVPAGGMTRERAAELVAFYGRDAALLVGGSLLDAPDLEAATRALVDAVAEAAAALPGALSVPRIRSRPRRVQGPSASIALSPAPCQTLPIPSSCRRCAPSARRPRAPTRGTPWRRSPTSPPVRTSATSPGRCSSTARPRRAWSCATSRWRPGGHSTFERHEHLHAVLILRGRGRGARGRDRFRRSARSTWCACRRCTGTSSTPADDAPLGFLCLVACARDRPQRPSEDEQAALRAHPVIGPFMRV